MSRTCVRKTTRERLDHYTMVDPNSGCWLWTGSVTRNGYGQTTMGDGKPMKAHRVAYLTHVGQIPTGMMVCHKCDTPSCINPDHLFLGTGKDNQRDAINKGRNACGERQGSSKLTEDQVREIRALSASGLSDGEIAPRFNVIPANIHHIKTFNSWKHVA